jgi:hypothetical protein
LESDSYPCSFQTKSFIPSGVSSSSWVEYMMEDVREEEEGLYGGDLGRISSNSRSVCCLTVAEGVQERPAPKVKAKSQCCRRRDSFARSYRQGRTQIDLRTSQVQCNERVLREITSSQSSSTCDASLLRRPYPNCEPPDIPVNPFTLHLHR